MKKTIRLTESDLLNIINKSLCKLTEASEKEQIDDFFAMLERDPKKNAFAFVYYAAPLNSSMNKFIKDENGENLFMKKSLSHSPEILFHGSWLLNFGFFNSEV